MNIEELEYNSQRDELILPEYGRHIQNLIQYACTIKDDDQRQKFTAYIVKLMEQINPGDSKGDEITEKLWKHAVMISDYQLEVKMPNGDPITKMEEYKKPSPMEYPQKELKFSHYGHNIMRMIEKAIEMEDGPKKDEFTRVIGSYMKLAYKNWHKEHYASDESIKADLKSISEGKLELDDSDNLNYMKSSRRNHRSSNSNKGRGRSNRGRRRNRGRKRK